MAPTPDAAPLHGIQVLDFGQYLAGPAAAMILGDLGAEVIRVDPPGGPCWDVPCTRVLNRNKQSIALDLTNPGDRNVARALAARTDVLIENFRPGVMRKLGLGARELCQPNPGLVYLSLPGFSAQDPERAHIQAWEAVVASAVGQFTDMGLNRVLMGIDPSFSPLPLASSYAAVLGALSVVLAIRARELDGHGEVIEVPLAAALAEGLAHNSTHVHGLPERYVALREREIQRRRRDGEAFDLSYDEVHGLMDAFYRPYVCADGRPFALVCVSSALHPERALKLLGIWEEAQRAGVPTFDPYLPRSAWPSGADCTIRAHPLAPHWNEWLSTRIAAAIAEQPSSHWEQLFAEVRAPGVAHRTTAEWLTEKHPLQAELLIEVDDPQLGRLKQPGKLVWLEGRDEHRPPRPAPRLDADREAVLSRLQVPTRTGTDAAPGEARDEQSRPWLADIRILDLTNVIAGPTIASTLARFGAQVTKLDPVNPSFDPWNTVLCGLQTNRGKRSLLANVAADGGAELLERLVAQADVITVNATSSQLIRLGLSRERIAAINPDAILCQLDAWSGPNHGPWSERLGYDDLVQAATGITARFGGGLATVEEHAHFGTIDVLGGFCGALAVAAALLTHTRDGEATVARTSLAAAGQLIQLPFMLDFPDREPFDEPSGPTTLGHGPCYRCYQTRDGWIFMACKPDAVLKVLREFDLPGDLPERQMGEELTKALAPLTTDIVLSRLWQLDVGAHRLERIHDVRRRHLNAAEPSSGTTRTLSFGATRDHPSGYLVEQVEPCAICLARAPIAALTPAPKYGAHTVEVLAELGYDAESTQRLFNAQIVGDRWSDEYLPA